MPTVSTFLPEESTYFLITAAPGVDAPGLEVAFRKDGSAMGLRVRGQEGIGFALSGDAARALVALISEQMPGGRYLPALPLAYDSLGDEGEAEGAALEAQAEEVEDSREGLAIDQGVQGAAPRVEAGEE